MDDPRFIKIKKDPRFKSLPKKQLKTKLNKKFNAVLKDPKFSTKPRFDKYGNKRQQNNEFQDMYEQSEDENLEQSQSQEQQEQSQNESVDFVQQNQEESSDEESNISMSSGLDKWEEEEEDNKQIPIVLQATNRLALQNYNWQDIAPKDLFVLFSSFVPQGNSIQSVQVYLSEFGKQKLQEENEHGPIQIFKDNFKSSKEKDSIIYTNELIVKGNDEELDVDPIKLRQYEKDRLKYYYAVIICDNPKTADAIYQQTNGQEFEQTNIKIDLRFIPNDVQLPKENLKNVCNTLPSQVNAINVVNRAMGHTDVKLTWEESKPRTNFWNKNAKQFNKEDWEEIIGNYESEDEDKIKNDVKELVEQIQDKEESDDNNWKNAFQKKKKSNVQIKFQSGFNPNGNNAILDRMPQKQKINAPKEGKIDDFFVGFDQDEQNDEERPKEHLNYIEKKKLRKQQLKEKKHQQAELALLVDDQNKKNKITINTQDSRFNAIYTKPDYAIDPTSKLFKQSQTFDEQINRKKKKLF